jgi:hypothetical protein
MPLLHFVLVGAVLAGLHALVWPKAPVRPPPVIADAATLLALEQDWVRTTGRAPTERELDLALQDWVDQELLVRAALDHGIQHTDALIQRRLIQNQRFVDEGSGAKPLGDDELLARAFALGLERSDRVVRRRLVERMREIILAPDRHGTPGTTGDEASSPDETGPPETWIRLSQLHLSRDRRGSRLEADATELRERLRDDGLRPDAAEISSWGDPLIVPRDLPLMTRKRLAARLGAAFAEAAGAAPIGEWSGPIPGSYGLHLVWVHERHERAASTAAARAAARTEARERTSVQEALQILRRDVDVIRYDRPTSPVP